MELPPSRVHDQTRTLNRVVALTVFRSMNDIGRLLGITHVFTIFYTPP